MMTEELIEMTRPLALELDYAAEAQTRVKEQPRVDEQILDLDPRLLEQRAHQRPIAPHVEEAHRERAEHDAVLYGR